MHPDGGCDHAGVKDQSVDETFRALKRELFNLAVTDWVSVQEVWSMGDGAFNDLPPDRRLQLVQQAVHELVEGELLAVYRGRWDSAEREKLPLDEARRVLAAWDTWMPDERPSVFVAGEEPSDPFTWRATLDSL
jgi:hypothetical protein